MTTVNETTQQPANGQASIFKKIAAVMGKITRVTKEGRNSFHNYGYATAEDMFDAVRSLMSEERLALFMSRDRIEQRDMLNAQGKAQIHTLIDWTFTFACGDTGATHSVQWTSEAMDTGDKSIAKAATSGLKYFLRETFMISTGDDPAETDPDHSSPEVKYEDAPTFVANQVTVVRTSKGTGMVKVSNGQQTASAFTTRIFADAGYDVSNWKPNGSDLTITLQPPAVIKTVRKGRYLNIDTVTAQEPDGVDDHQSNDPPAQPRRPVDPSEVEAANRALGYDAGDARRL